MPRTCPPDIFGAPPGERPYATTQCDRPAGFTSSIHSRTGLAPHLHNSGTCADGRPYASHCRRHTQSVLLVGWGLTTPSSSAPPPTQGPAPPTDAGTTWWQPQAPAVVAGGKPAETLQGAGLREQAPPNLSPARGREPVCRTSCRPQPENGRAQPKCSEGDGASYFLGMGYQGHHVHDMGLAAGLRTLNRGGEFYF